MNKPERWLSVTIPGRRGALEAVENFLFELGCCGLENLENGVRAWFPEPWDERGIKRRLTRYGESLMQMGADPLECTFSEIDREDWGEGWKKYFKPVTVGSRFLVRPPWESAPVPDRLEIIINPALAFGTGTHETTQLVMELMEELAAPGCRVLDSGTGSGVLALAAVKLGAGSVTAFDIDPDALANAAENLALNGAQAKVRLVHGGLADLPPQQYDLVLANINRHVLVSLIPHFVPFLKKGGSMILSGILIEEHEHLLAALSGAGFDIRQQRRKGEWEALIVSRS